MLTPGTIDLIYEIHNLESYPTEFDWTAVSTAISLSPYYVPPGNDTERFSNALENTIKAGETLGTQIFATRQDDSSLELCVAFTVGYLSILLIKNFIDINYFEAQVNKFKAENPPDKELLKDYLFKLSKEQLKDFFEIIINFNLDDCFLSDAGTFDMIQELNNKCLAADEKINKVSEIEFYNDIFEESARLFADYSGNFFELLPPETIAGIFFKHLDKNNYIVGRIAELIYKEGHDSAVNFICSIKS